MGRGGGGQVVSVLAFYSDDPSSNLAEAYSVFLYNTENKQKEARVGPFFLKKRKRALKNASIT